MDPNQQSQPQPMGQPVPAQQPAVITQNPSQSTFVAQKSGGNKTFIIALVILIILAVLGGAYFLLMGQKSSTSNQTPIPTKTTVLPTSVPTQASLSEDQEVQQVDVGDIESDFKDIASDVQEL